MHYFIIALIYLAGIALGVWLGVWLFSVHPVLGVLWFMSWAGNAARQRATAR